jgi:hypothetical protein
MKDGVIMKFAKIVSLLGVIAMTIALINGFVNGSFIDDGVMILNNPWGIVSLVDLYVGFVLFALWMYYREKSLLSSVIWIILIMVLGFFIGALYVFIALMTSKDDWLIFFLGEKNAALAIKQRTQSDDNSL